MQLRHLWPTPIAQDMLVLPEDMRIGLINVLLRKEADREKIRDTSPDFHRFMTSKKFYASTHYNLFAEADDHPERDAILAFQNMAVGLLRSYLKQAYQISEEETVEVSGRCFGNVQSSGARTFHRSFGRILASPLISQPSARATITQHPPGRLSTPSPPTIPPPKAGISAH